MKIELAKNAGFCFGVKRAVQFFEDGLGDLPKPVRILGHLVHNDQVIKKLEKEGVQIIKSTEGINDGTLVITAHGISPLIKKELQKRSGLTIVDTTCPKVLKVQILAKKLLDEDRKVVIIGDRSHVEVLGINGATGNSAFMVSKIEELEKLPIEKNQPVGVVVQTTQEVDKTREMENWFLKNFSDVKFHNTICEATEFRQKEAREMAAKNEAMIVVGSKTSANTTRLFEICSEINSKTFFIDTADDLSLENLKGCRSVGVTAGASAPWWVIDEVINKLKDTN